MKRRNYSRRLQRWGKARRCKTGFYVSGQFMPSEPEKIVSWNGLSVWINTGYSERGIENVT